MKILAQVNTIVRIFGKHLDVVAILGWAVVLYSYIINDTFIDLDVYKSILYKTHY